MPTDLPTAARAPRLAVLIDGENASARIAEALFGLTGEAAEAVALPDDWDDIHRLEGADLAEAFEALGWDVTDKRRKPLRLMPHYALPLALAIRGLAGELPFVAEPDHPTTDWGAGLAADAARFRQR